MCWYECEMSVWMLTDGTVKSSFMPCKSCLDLLLQLATGMTNREYSGNIHSLGTFGWGEGRQGKHEKCGRGNMKKVSYISNQALLAPNM